MIENSSSKKEMIFGVHAVLNLLETNPAKIVKILVAKEALEKKFFDIMKIARKNKITINAVDKQKFAKFDHYAHQGIIAFVTEYDYKKEEDFTAAVKNGYKGNVVFADGITDTQNLGAIIRTAYLMGVEWIFVPYSSCAPINEVVIKASSGAAYKVNVVKMKREYSDFARFVKELGFELIILDIKSDTIVDNYYPENPFVLVTGGESKGVNFKLLKECTTKLRLRMIDGGEINSYNTSVSLAMALYSLTRWEST